MDFTAFRERLQLLFNSHGKNLSGYSDDLNISVATLSRYLSGDRTPDLAYVLKLSEHFNVSIDWLLGLNGEKFEVLPPETQEMLHLYEMASNDDRRVIQAVLNKYKKEE